VATDYEICCRICRAAEPLVMTDLATASAAVVAFRAGHDHGRVDTAVAVERRSSAVEWATAG
jgi:hypothetical protein